MNCSHQSSQVAHHSGHHCRCGCGCGGQKAPLNNPMWSSKKKIRFLEDRLKDLNDQKSDIQELIDEMKGK